jgi:ABC-2 type transport system ATP-binding protein
MPATPPLMLADVDKTIAGRPVLREVSIECAPGTITALLGPNGAGKTTTVTIATGLRRPSAGSAQVFGHAATSSTARNLFSLVPQEVSLPGPVPVKSCLDFVAGQRPASSFGLSRERICKQLGIAELLGRSVGALSGGQRRRVALALGLVAVPGLLILDEATTNLDELARAQAWRLVRDYAAAGGCVLVTSHILADIESHADRVVAMAEGRVVLQNTLAEVRSLLGGSTVSALVAPAVLPQLIDKARTDGLGTLAASDPTSGTVTWRSSRPLALTALVAALAPDADELLMPPIPLGELLGRLASEALPQRTQ